MIVGCKPYQKKHLLRPTIIILMVGLIFSDAYGQLKVHTLSGEKGITAIEVVGVPNNDISQIQDSLQVRLAGKSQKVLGSYEIDGNLTRFKPHWALDKSLTFDVFWSNKLLKTIKPLGAQEVSDTEVINIYPDVDRLPANLLKLYIQFSAPMSEGQSAKYINLVKDGEDTVSRAFLNLSPELWNEDRTILTLWVEPGRVKRDLGPNRILGKALEVDDRFELVIDQAWEDVDGIPLKKAYVKNFQVIEDDRIKPRLENWVIRVPKVSSKESLVLQFNESLDYMLAQEVLTVKKGGAFVSGNLKVNSDGRSWSLTPYKEWESGDYIITVGTKLEDLAGNNLNRLFDVDLHAQDSKKRSTQSFYELTFKIH